MNAFDRFVQVCSGFDFSMAKIGVYSKRDLLMAYGVRMAVFEKWIEEIKPEINWKTGKQQKFPPKSVQRIFEYLGEP